MSAVTNDVVLVDIMGAVITNVNADTYLSVNYEPGRWYQILQELSDLDNSISLKGIKFPLFAMQMPIKEKRGGERPGFATVIIPRIVIAVLTKSGDGTERVLDKYASGGTFKTTLYPLYNAFLKWLARSTSVINNDPDNFIHTKMDNPGQQATESSTNDFIDSIEILDLELQLRQIKTC